ncbi:MAG TPA: hypothetical protein VFG16_10790 [Streptomyces sp.]|nr:hypothetical protein [Streptomyces sp.]HET6354697.1 hypothetical protein [Streptomyces sp.]
MGSEVQRQGYPPSMREIGTVVSLASASSVAHQLAGTSGFGADLVVGRGRAGTVSVHQLESRSSRGGS